ncbi:glycophorin-A isoform X2 [Peromyscus maniculatus bairdii]|uniref:glycophorin-A isoform X2 n=1 Tax=Peromyscus maniculatus bairdii TaxID=230844 RepID=UPI00042AB530|nr:glycophorin-A isoform X1 [Peromyscus maniculatus bairdii]
MQTVTGEASTSDSLHVSTAPLIPSTEHYQREHLVSLPATGTSVKPFDMSPSDPSVTPEIPVLTAQNGTGLERYNHPFSEPVTIAIVLGVIAGIVGTILLFYYLISLVTKKSSVDIHPPKSEDTDVHLSSIEQSVVQEEPADV